MPDKNPKTRFFALAATVVAASLLFFILIRPAVSSWGKSRAVSLDLTASHSKNTGKQIALYELALMLYPHDKVAAFGLADVLARRGDRGAAIRVLGLLPLTESGERIATLRYAAGNYTGAIATADKAYSLNHDYRLKTIASKSYLHQKNYALCRDSARDSLNLSSTVEARLLWVMCQTLGGQTASLPTAQTSELTTLQKAAAGDINLADLLYSQAYYEPAKDLLLRSTTENSRRYELLARLELIARPAKSNWQAAQADLVKAVNLAPADIGLRKLLVTVDQKLGDQVGAAEQSQKIQALESGQI